MSKLMNCIETQVVDMSAMTCPVILETMTQVKLIKSHGPDHETADFLESVARGYEVLWKGTGSKHYKEKMQACLDDARDYRACGFVRPVGATISEANNS